MEKPSNLEPNRLIKLVTINFGDDRIVYKVAKTHDEYHQTWKQAFMFKGGTKIGVDAQYSNGFKVDWDEVHNWDYINFDELIDWEYIKKNN